MKPLGEIFGSKKDSTQFTWDTYCGTVGVSVMEIFDSDSNSPVNDRFLIEGWCYGNELPVRPRDDGYALWLFDVENEEFLWCHLCDDLLESIMYRISAFKIPQ